ncbi:MAG: hypothetical protein QME68_05720 [Elusimicrobiota bacterium]|nr:hypothetical protein [Elusimicrobiota bacterium]
MSLSSINNLHRWLEKLPAKIVTLLGVLTILLKLLEQYSLKILTMPRGDLTSPYVVFVIQLQIVVMSGLVWLILIVLTLLLFSVIGYLREKEPQKTIEEKKEETQIETKLEICPVCDGKGNVKCNCENGYLLPKLEGGSRSIDLQKKDNKWIYKVRGTSVRNVGIAGTAKLHVKVMNKYSDEILGKRSEIVKLKGYDWNEFDLEYDFDLGNLEGLTKYIGDREPKTDDLTANVYFTDFKPKEKCPRCDGKGTLVCWRCKGKKSA